MVHYTASEFIFNLGEFGNFIKQKLFRGKTKLNVKDLAQILRKDSESIDAYMSMFNKMKAKYVTLTPKYYLVQKMHHD